MSILVDRERVGEGVRVGMREKLIWRKGRMSLMRMNGRDGRGRGMVKEGM